MPIEPIDEKTTSAELIEDDVTWCIQAVFVNEAGIIDDPMIEVFRGVVRRVGELTIFTPNMIPFRIKASELGSLAEFADVPESFPFPIGPYLAVMPKAIQVAGNALPKKALSAAEQGTL